MPYPDPLEQWPLFSKTWKPAHIFGQEASQTDPPEQSPLFPQTTPETNTGTEWQKGPANNVHCSEHLVRGFLSGAGLHNAVQPLQKQKH